MNKLLSLLPCAFILLLFSECGGTKTGGDCQYTTTIVPATVIAVLPAPDGESAEVLFEVSTSNGSTDTLYYSKQFNKPAYSDDLISLNLHIGNALKCEHRVRTTGSCDPELFLLKEEAYK